MIKKNKSESMAKEDAPNPILSEILTEPSLLAAALLGLGIFVVVEGASGRLLLPSVILLVDIHISLG